MAEAERRSPLAAVLEPARHGAAVVRTPELVLSERRPLSMVQVESDEAGAPEVVARVGNAFRVTPPVAFNRMAGDDVLAIHWIGPHRWLVVAPAGRELEVLLADALAGTEAAVVELSHGRTAIRLAGGMARQVLAKGAGLDFHSLVFTPGVVVQTALFHVAVLIACLDDSPAFEIHAPRGFARSLWESLTDAAAEYGYHVV